MSKKSKSQTRAQGDGQSHKTQPGHWMPIVIAVGLGIVLLGGAALLGPWLKDRAVPAPGAAGDAGPAGRTIANILPPPAAGTRTPINDADPVTGKALTPVSPTLTYKGYVIGFCCGESGGYRGGWDRMSEREKDAFVRRHLK